eukprot:GAHX01001182.1.p1 GENE.GAHX01001182.1~~GAHX01001182.1.p1  ORF type:complete len:266 (-),score=39.22 GAHX01001182.1:268-1020(-)
MIDYLQIREQAKPLQYKPIYFKIFSGFEEADFESYQFTKFTIHINIGSQETSLFSHIAKVSSHQLILSEERFTTLKNHFGSNFQYTSSIQEHLQIEFDNKSYQLENNELFQVITADEQIASVKKDHKMSYKWTRVNIHQYPAKYPIDLVVAKGTIGNRITLHSYTNKNGCYKVNLREITDGNLKKDNNPKYRVEIELLNDEQLFETLNKRYEEFCEFLDTIEKVKDGIFDLHKNLRTTRSARGYGGSYFY